jgi:hypothetical protein
MIPLDTICCLAICVWQADLFLMLQNCMRYNEESSVFYKTAKKIQRIVKASFVNTITAHSK